MTNDGQLNEDEEDHKATLYYDLEKEMNQIFEEFFKEPNRETRLFTYMRKLMMLEMEYETEGLSLEEMREIRKGRINGK